jgi:serine/threonine protein kinase
MSRPTLALKVVFDETEFDAEASAMNSVKRLCPFFWGTNASRDDDSGIVNTDSTELSFASKKEYLRWVFERKEKKEFGGGVIIMRAADTLNTILLTLDYVLRHILRTTGPEKALLKADFLRGIDQVREELKQLHDFCYVHTDIRPHNIMRFNGKWHLIDYGVAQKFDGGKEFATVKLRITPPFGARMAHLGYRLKNELAKLQTNEKDEKDEKDEKTGAASIDDSTYGNGSSSSSSGSGSSSSAVVTDDTRHSVQWFPADDFRMLDAATYFP